MSFDYKNQNTRADKAFEYYMVSATDTERKHLFDKLTPGQSVLMRLMARRMYAIAYQEGWENARTQP